MYITVNVIKFLMHNDEGKKKLLLNDRVDMADNFSTSHFYCCSCNERLWVLLDV